ncbi:hypothetical protein Nepgr_026076 [Nepenthes gracilis]|uniref:Uncharacterized protein n=1 Tax=Nepenthes gracilis TaxID=150966 RepID=A0AAD3T7E1_NEPGR|nr:hypothetical protein Nepgr_026076 [Nepenthes gracilis]
MEDPTYLELGKSVLQPDAYHLLQPASTAAVSTRFGEWIALFPPFIGACRSKISTEEPFNEHASSPVNLLDIATAVPFKETNASPPWRAAQEA